MFYLGLIDKTASLASDPDLTSVEQSWKHIHWSCVLQWQRKNVREGCPEHPLKAFHGYWRKITVNPLYQIILNHTIITEFSRPTSKGKSFWKGRILWLPFASLKFEIQENYSMSEKTLNLQMVLSMKLFTNYNTCSHEWLCRTECNIF